MSSSVSESSPLLRNLSESSPLLREYQGPLIVTDVSIGGRRGHLLFVSSLLLLLLLLLLSAVLLFYVLGPFKPEFYIESETETLKVISLNTWGLSLIHI